MKTNTLLALDTTSSPLMVTVLKNGKVFYARKSGIKQEEYLFPIVNKTLAKADATLRDVKKVFYIRGPGRFTGIRIGLTLASVLRSLTGAHACSATMFEVLHYAAVRSKEFGLWQVENKEGKIAVVLHAFREEYFLQIFDGSEPKWMTKEEMLLALASYAAPLFVIGFDKERAYIDGLLAGTRHTIGPAFLCKINPASLAALAQERNFEENTLEPLYLKPARFETGK